MKNSKHCEICDLQSFNFNDGIICSLTNKKAEFKDKCSDIKFDKKLKDKLIEVNTEFENSKYVKNLAIGNMVFYGLIGITVLFLCYYLSIKFLRLGILHSGTIVIFSIGLGIIGAGIGTLNYSKQKRNAISPKKINLDKLTEIYNVKYQFDFHTSTDMMGIKETKIKLKLNGKTIEKTNRY